MILFFKIFFKGYIKTNFVISRKKLTNLKVSKLNSERSRRSSGRQADVKSKKQELDNPGDLINLQGAYNEILPV